MNLVPLKLFLVLSLFFSNRAFVQEKDVLHYSFFIELNKQSDTVKGSAKIYYVHQEHDPVVSFDLVSVGRNGKGMKVLNVTGHYDDPYAFEHKKDSLFIRMRDVKKGDTCEINIDYEGIPADGLIISKNKYGDRTFFSDHWPDRARHWLPCNDRPDDKATVSMMVIAPQSYKVISNGIFAGEESEEGRIISLWMDTVPIPTKVIAIGAARFAVKTFEDSPQGIPVSAWVYPQDSVKGFYDYALAPSILKFFVNYIGPYPFKKLANVQSKTIFGGMENASAIFYAESSVTGDRSSEDLLAHEIAHQWFGNMATEKSFAHLWLSEGFATYLTNIYLQNKYGAEKLKERMEEDRKEIIAFARVNKNPVVDSTVNLMSLLNANSYQKGGWVLHMLRNEVGNEVFQKILQTYYNRYARSNAETRDFEKVAEEVSGKELTWFFNQWLYRGGLPEIFLETKIQDGFWFLYATQKGEPYQLSLEVEIVDSDNTVHREVFQISGTHSVLKVPVKGNRIMYSLDPDVKVLIEL